ncbi:uroporphyrinogen-III synthase [Microvirga pudoricolor]|uniref:uroporphyrinogen-III synthase n=1 Tax=Microvirga pudoricolor TaxID=2778729 RepID=UPI00195232A8|nr:uroporphyrinogen-III synthase [Microvirga pudoricolor]MBM6593753.1 uroporphyrinogen-III synthase [Microvirga pudoricolor]
MRVLVTRAPEAAARTAARLAQQGHEAVLAPVLTVVPTGERPPEGPFDACLLTSAHAVPALAAEAAGGPVFAVGSRTAAAARAAGLGPVHEAEGDARSLTGLVRGSLPAPARLLHATGRHRKPEPEAALRALGYGIVIWETYDAQPVARLPDNAIAALRTGNVGAALHYSRRSADLFRQLVEEAGLAAGARDLSHLCLSADVARPLAAAGFRTAVAAGPNEDALLALLGGDGAPP